MTLKSFLLILCFNITVGPGVFLFSNTLGLNVSTLWGLYVPICSGVARTHETEILSLDDLLIPVGLFCSNTRVISQ